MEFLHAEGLHACRGAQAGQALRCHRRVGLGIGSAVGSTGVEQQVHQAAAARTRQRLCLRQFGHAERFGEEPQIGSKVHLTPSAS